MRKHLSVGTAFGIQAVLTAVSVYLYNSNEGFDSFIAVYTAVPSILLGLLIIATGTRRIRLKQDSSYLTYLAVGLNIAVPVLLIMAAILNLTLYPE